MNKLLLTIALFSSTIISFAQGSGVVRDQLVRDYITPQRIVPEGKVDIHGAYGDYCYNGYRHSLCHGWSSGPCPWLTEHVLGKLLRTLWRRWYLACSQRYLQR